MNTRAKGNQRERLAQNELEAAGYLVERARPDLRWIGPGRCISVAHDLFGAFDLLAVQQSETRAISICEDSGGHAATRRHVLQSIKARLPVTWQIELWRYRGGQARRRDRIARGWVRERLRQDTSAWEELPEAKCATIEQEAQS